MERILGIDYGSRRIGLALSDLLGITAQPLLVIERTSLTADIEKIETVVRDSGVTKIVIGMPFNMDGTEGNLAGDVKAFAKRLQEKFNIAVEFTDERLTTAQTERMLVEEADLSREKRKKVRDKLAAALLLQSYMDQHSL